MEKETGFIEAPMSLKKADRRSCDLSLSSPRVKQTTRKTYLPIMERVSGSMETLMSSNKKDCRYESSETIHVKSSTTEEFDEPPEASLFIAFLSLKKLLVFVKYLWPTKKIESKSSEDSLPKMEEETGSTENSLSAAKTMKMRQVSGVVEKHSLNQTSNIACKSMLSYNLFTWISTITCFQRGT